MSANPFEHSVLVPSDKVSTPVANARYYDFTAVVVYFRAPLTFTKISGPPSCLHTPLHYLHRTNPPYRSTGVPHIFDHFKSEQSNCAYEHCCGRYRRYGSGFLADLNRTTFALGIMCWTLQ